MYTTSFAAPGQRTGLRRPARLAAYSLFALVIPSLLGSQSRRRCPQFARVPGYGACTNISGPDCGFCTLSLIHI